MTYSSREELENLVITRHRAGASARTLAKEGSAHDIHGYRAEFRTLVERAAGAAGPPRPGAIPGVEAPRADPSP